MIAQIQQELPQLLLQVYTLFAHATDATFALAHPLRTQDNRHVCCVALSFSFDFSLRYCMYGLIGKPRVLGDLESAVVQAEPVLTHLVS